MVSIDLDSRCQRHFNNFIGVLAFVDLKLYCSEGNLNLKFTCFGPIRNQVEERRVIASFAKPFNSFEHFAEIIDTLLISFLDLCA